MSNQVVAVKTYETPAEAQKDAEWMASQGWTPKGMTGGGSHFAPVHGTMKSLSSGVVWGVFGMPPALGLLGRKKWRQSDPLVVTWVREATPAPDPAEMGELEDGKCSVVNCVQPHEPGSVRCRVHPMTGRVLRMTPEEKERVRAAKNLARADKKLARAAKKLARADKKRRR